MADVVVWHVATIEDRRAIRRDERPEQPVESAVHVEYYDGIGSGGELVSVLRAGQFQISRADLRHAVGHRVAYGNSETLVRHRIHGEGVTSRDPTIVIDHQPVGAGQGQRQTTNVVVGQ